MKKLMLVALLVGVSLVGFNEAYAQQGNRFYDTFIGSLGSTANADANYVLDLVTNVAGFLMILGGVIAGIALIASGFMYMAAGSNQTKVAAAKSIFKNGVIGALIIFGFGIIINTVVNVGTDPFYFFQ